MDDKVSRSNALDKWLYLAKKSDSKAKILFLAMQSDEMPKSVSKEEKEMVEECRKVEGAIGVFKVSSISSSPFAGDKQVAFFLSQLIKTRGNVKGRSRAEEIHPPWNCEDVKWTGRFFFFKKKVKLFFFLTILMSGGSTLRFLLNLALLVAAAALWESLFTPPTTKTKESFSVIVVLPKKSPDTTKLSFPSL